MQIKLIFTTKVLHLASFIKEEFLELVNGLIILGVWHFCHVIPLMSNMIIDIQTYAWRLTLADYGVGCIEMGDCCYTEDERKV